MKTGEIKQTEIFPITPDEAYELFMNAEMHAKIVGTKVIMSQEIDGKFEIFDGYCRGYNISLDKGHKIIQAWHFEEEGWDEDFYSICTFTFDPIEEGTKLTLEQTNVPLQTLNALEDGWKTYYWDPIHNLLEK